MLRLDAKTDTVVKAADVRRREILLTKLFGAIIRESRCLAREGGGGLSGTPVGLPHDSR